MKLIALIQGAATDTGGLSASQPPGLSGPGPTPESGGFFEHIFNSLEDYTLSRGVFAILVVVLFVAQRVLMNGPSAKGAEAKLPRQLIMLGLTIFGLLATMLTMPLPDEVRSDVLSLVGVLFTAIIALSSTTFVANAMAGLMVRMIKCFKPGDFVRVKDEFGRITERGLFHTELQTEDGDLTTLPNLYLMTNPVSVVRKSGTVISAKVSIGYDESREKIEVLLKRAAEKAKLTDAFVHVLELGDYSIVYKIAGFSDQVKSLLTTRSNLRKQMLDSLHNANVEIMSPAFMTQRRIPQSDAMIPTRTHRSASSKAEESAPEDKIFDKANRAENIESLKTKHAKVLEQIAEHSETKPKGDEKQHHAERLKELESQAKSLLEEIDLGAKQLLDDDEEGQ